VDPAKAASGEVVRVRGLVLDPEGKPVAGAKVYLAGAAPDGPAPSPRAASGPDGRFRFAASRSGLKPDTATRSPLQVMAVAEGYGCDWAPIGPGAVELTLRLVKDVPINGRILDPDGRPVAGARLTVRGVSAAAGEDLAGFLAEARQGYGYAFAKKWLGPLPGRPAVLTTGADGRFRLTSAGRERVVFFRVEGPAIALAGLGPVMTRVAETFADPKGRHVYGASFDYVAFASRPIRGVVRDKDTGKPLAGVAVGHYDDNPPRTVTDQEGRYELLGMGKARQYVLDVNPADGRYFRQRVRLADTPGLGALTADIELTRGLTVRGRVTDRATGQPVARARVEYHPLGGNPYANRLASVSKPCAQAATGPDGSYTITVMPGPGVIGVTGPKLEAYMPAWVTSAERKAFFKTPLVDDNGEDYLTVAGGANSFGAIGQDAYHALVLLEPGEKDTRLVKDVALERPQERQGRMVGPDGRPLAGVTAIGLVPYFPHSSDAETLAADTFTVRGINPRAKRPLVFRHKDKQLGFYLQDLRAAPPGPLTIQLQPCGSASGRVVDGDGRPVAGLRLHVPGRALHSIGDGGWVTTDKEGRFRAEGLVAGQPYWVWDASGSYPRVFAEVVVGPGGHKDMGDIRMSERRE
jgi:protocatechuate 3,4-dioxygenase beta subunit